MSFFSTTTKLTHRTRLPSNTTYEDAIALLHDHDFLLHLDPEVVKYTTNEPPPNANPATKYYTVTDHMDALPRAIYDTTVTFNAEITDTPTGIGWVIKAPLGLTQNTSWRVEAAPEGETGFYLVEECEISCSRLLIGMVKAKTEGNYPTIHGKVVDRLASMGK